MGWPNVDGAWPPFAGDKHILQIYKKRFQILDAFAERFAAVNNSAIWTFGSGTWFQGTISGIQSIITDRLTITVDDAVGWIDGSGVKRWYNFSGVFGSSDLRPYAPGFYKAEIFPPESYNHNFADPNRGLIYDILDNDNGSIDILDDGQLLLNGLTLSDYVGWKINIIRSGSGTQRGYGWTECHPPKANFPELDYGRITASTTSSVTDARTALDVPLGWHVPKQWTVDQWKNKQVILQVGSQWKRLTISGNTINKLTFSSQTVAPAVSNEFWIVEPDKWWTPRFRLSLTQVQGRLNRYWTHNAQFRPWAPATWYSGLRHFGIVNTHNPETDEVQSYGVHDQTLTLQLSESDAAACEDVALQIFDIPGARTGLIDYCGNEDHLFNPWIYWSIRGLQLILRSLVPHFVKPISYTGQKDIHIFDLAEWFQFHSSSNVRITTISAYDGSVTVTTSGITMPEQTPLFGAWPALGCSYRVTDIDNKTLSTGTGVATSTGLTLDESWGPGGADYVDQALIISFNEERRWPRRVKYIYRRTWYEPDEGDTGDLVVPPDQDHPGTYFDIFPSDHYAEYVDLGDLQESGPAFVTGESARYTAQNWDDGRGSDMVDLPQGEWTNVSYMGWPNFGTPFPRWQGAARARKATGGGSFFLEDTAQHWWVTENPLIIHSGTGGGTSTDTILRDPTQSANKFWYLSMGGHRFVGHTLRVRVHDSSGPDDPEIWERRFITAHTNTDITVNKAFSTSLDGKHYELWEPGYDSGKGCILNLWIGRRLKVVHRATGVTGFAWILGNDNHTIWFNDNDLGFSVSAEDDYEIIQFEAGEVLQRRPANVNAHNGWVRPEDAVQDTRGANWHIGSRGPRENLPTVVKGYGLCCKFDYYGLWMDLHFYRGLNALIWTVGGYGWTNQGEDNIFGFNYVTSPQWTWPDTAPGGIYGSYGAAWSQLQSDTQLQFDTSGPNLIAAGDNIPPNSNMSAHTIDYSGTVGQPAGTVGSTDELQVTRQYAYPKITGVHDLMNSSVDFYGYGVIDTTDPDEGESNPWPTHEEGIFNADGTILQFRKWVLMSSSGPSNATTRIGTRVGRPNTEISGWTQPTDPLSHSSVGPPAVYASSLRLEGFALKEDYKAIIRWDVTGGFIYTP